jgi:hypothetical protein
MAGPRRTILGHNVITITIINNNNNNNNNNNVRRRQVRRRLTEAGGLEGILAAAGRLRDYNIYNDYIMIITFIMIVSSVMT